MSNRTMAQVRAECLALGVQPGRSVAECERRIAERRASPGFLGAAINAAAREAITGATFAEAAIAEAPEPITAAEEAAMREHSAERARMDEMGEAAWMAEQFKPRMSRTMRMLCDTTAICGTLARNPLIYGGDQGRFIYAHREGVAIAAGIAVRRGRVPPAVWNGATTGRWR